MRVAIFGAGGIAQRAYLPILTSLPGVEITGIFSRARENAQKISEQFHIDFATDNSDELISTKPEAAFVLTNNASHFPLAQQLMNRGVDVFVEKPLAETTDEVRRLVEQATKKKRILMVGFNRRYDLLYNQSKELMRNSSLQMAIFEKHRNVVSHTNIYNNYLDDTIHQIDLMRYLCGEVIPLNTQVQMQDGKVVGAISTTKMEGGGLAVLLTSLRAGAWQERVTLHGNNRTIEVEAFRQLKVKYPDRDEIYGVDRAGNWVSDMKERGFYGAIEHFFHCILTREAPLTGVVDVLRTHELIDALVLAAGEKIEKPEGGWDKADYWSKKRN